MTPGERHALHEIVRMMAFFQCILSGLLVVMLVCGGAALLGWAAQGNARGVRWPAWLLVAGLWFWAAYVASYVPHYVQLARGG